MTEEKSFVLCVNQNAATYLYRVTRWSKFFAVLGFIFTAFILLMVLAMIAFGSFLPLFSRALGGGTGAPAMIPGALIIAFGFVYMIIAVLYFVTSLKLYRFADKTALALKGNSDEQLEEGFKNLSAYLKFLGIITIVFLSLYVLFFVVCMLAGAGAAIFGGGMA